MKNEKFSDSEAEIYTFKVCREPYFAVISTSGNGNCNPPADSCAEIVVFAQKFFNQLFRIFARYF
jgi:hypothetical protein